MAIRINSDGSMTVGILPEEPKVEQETETQPVEKPKAKKSKNAK